MVNDPLRYGKTSLPGTDRWYTPPFVIEWVKAVLGEIYLDPCSAPEPQEWIQAQHYFTKEGNGLDRDWFASTVWCNPPGRRKNDPDPTLGFNKWFDKMWEEYEKGHFNEGILLQFNVAPGTVRFHKCIEHGVPICICKGRINYQAPAGTYDDPTQSSARNDSAFIYFGKNPERFWRVFSQENRFKGRPIGNVIAKVTGYNHSAD